MNARRYIRSMPLTLLAVAVLVAGCASRAAFQYRVSSRVETAPAPLQLKVAVLPFHDLRGEENTSAALLYLIPLMPYGWLDYERPEAASGFLFHAAYNFRPSEDLARAAVEELRQNGFFAEVFYTDREHEPGVDLILSGEIRETTYEGKMISYGLSAYGPLLWFLGLPAGTTYNGVALDLKLTRAADGAQLWSHQISGNWGKTVGLYYNWAADFDGFPLIMSDGLHEAMASLRDELRARPVAYWRHQPEERG